MDKDKNRLIEIAADSQVSEDELPDFLAIKDNLEKISIAVEALQLWFEKEYSRYIEAYLTSNDTVIFLYFWGIKG